MRDLESIAILALIVVAVAYFWKKLLWKNRQDALHKLNLNDAPAPPAPDTVKDSSSDKQEEPKEAKGARQEKENKGEPPTETAKERTAWEMCLEFLHKHNCDVEFSEDDEKLCWTNFQGTLFCLVARNDHILEVYYPQFHDVPLNQYDEISRIRKAINRVNMHDFFTLYYNIDENQQSLSVSVKRACFLVPEMKDSNGYLYSTLTACFEVARKFMYTLDTIRREELEQK